VGDGSKRNELEKLVKKLGLDKTVKFLGGLEDHSEVLSVMKSSKIFVNPSIREGFGITFIEAMASGCPVIGVRSPHNTTRELIKSGYNGLVSDLTPSDLSHNILRLLNNSNLMEEMSQNAISFAKNFSWDEITDKVENVYQNMMSKG
jgi:glycosyltransferase involved in cell wall biosynthesis